MWQQDQARGHDATTVVGVFACGIGVRPAKTPPSTGLAEESSAAAMKSPKGMFGLTCGMRVSSFVYDGLFRRASLP